MKNIVKCLIVSLLCVAELGFCGGAGRIFMLCHSLKCLVRTCKNRCFKLRSPLHLLEFTLSHLWFLARFSFHMKFLCLLLFISIILSLIYSHFQSLLPALHDLICEAGEASHEDLSQSTLLHWTSFQDSFFKTPWNEPFS